MNAFDLYDSKIASVSMGFFVQIEFQELKKRLTTAPVFIFPSPIESFVVYYDASKMGL